MIKAGSMERAMNVQIISCHTQTPKYVVKSNVFKSLLSGLVDENKYILSDLNGDNIANQVDFSEIRHHFYIWKNLSGSVDYIGLEHYRRRLFVDVVPLNRAPDTIKEWRHGFSCDQKLHELYVDEQNFLAHLLYRSSFEETDEIRLSSWLSNFDIILPRQWHLHDRPDLEAEWKMGGLPPLLWDIMIETLKEHKIFSPMPYFPIRTSNHSNIFIMKKEYFLEYMELLFFSLEKIQENMTGRVDIFPRIWGYIAEKLLNYFVLSKKITDPLLRVTYLPLINIDINKWT
jgi:hypothetical protein